MSKTTLNGKINDALDQRLLNAAVEVFLEKGFNAATVDEIAARAKASKLTFYNHYGNKEALFQAVVRRQNNVLVDSLSGHFPDDMPLETFLDTVAHRIFEVFLRSNAVKLLRVLHAEAARFPGLGNVFDKVGPTIAVKIISTQFKKYMALGVLHKADPVLAAEHFLHLTLGELTRRTLLGLRPAPSKKDINKRMEAGIDVFLKAYAT